MLAPCTYSSSCSQSYFFSFLCDLEVLVILCILQLLLSQMRTELLCNERCLRTQDHLALLLTPQQVCEELFHNEWLFLRTLSYVSWISQKSWLLCSQIQLWSKERFLISLVMLKIPRMYFHVEGWEGGWRLPQSSSSHNKIYHFKSCPWSTSPQALVG